MDGANDYKTTYGYSFVKDEQYGPGIPGAASLVSSFWKNGFLLKETKFSKSNNGIYDTVTTVENLYDEMNLISYYGLRVRPNVSMRGTDWRPQNPDYLFTNFNYSVDSGVKRMTSSIERIYKNGVKTGVNQTVYNYFNNRNIKPRLITRIESGGRVKGEYLCFPQDYMAGNLFKDNMVSANMLNYPIERLAFKGGGSVEVVTSASLSIYDEASRGILDKHYSLDSKNTIPLSGFKISNWRPGSAFTQVANSSIFGFDNRYILDGAILSVDAYANPREIRGRLD